ncbi:MULTISPECIES: 5-formyltetrahydrofolate cyclo-ligase [unclassified Planococcus (in: firmicutes)]|uniref:5-formyltetrahydrofolate cyclo-ligase n=1 Tax=unclassified Planococcus (in: firmicutes) TaxID=2662419 RepID=UPI000C3391BA|nr:MULTISPECIES: 5-formyltetrahydrofolate cyclo-ligase [unclassified Planococcus (in: firmicutes)]AUD13773.1 5-formyltetrahydrofolate cyclo-ligase [Planococcus sp. MB-3u-03]PKG45746.1 5-formyltetrahydrofolate cyclo-ligase [Planococcus sp. Urea-trap-24]PKG88545.1 5-formyltetrahydrofolate cyclo-ligase [Planococcus sp. Urea-3u-39]PKH38737.1 5-formyltetrahydrofolate cyclo-ligase [Planococcus sp. MB-3u-09]
MEKAVLRKSVIGQMSELTKSQHAQMSSVILEKLLEDPDFQKAETIGVTISRWPEVDTIPLIETCWRLGKRVAAPKCFAKDRTMDFRLFNRLGQLEVVYMDLQEPIEALTEAIGPESLDLLIVPGVVFTQSGYRIGFGGGYYDRYLSGFNGNTRSLAFDFQLTGELPIESHDIPVDGIITEKRTIDSKAVRA